MDKLSSLGIYLKGLEEKLMSPETRSSAGELKSLLADGFIELGSSGRVYAKREAIETLQTEISGEITLTEFSYLALAKDLILITYHALRRRAPREEPAVSLRSSIWRLHEDRWQIVFHQGTALNGDVPVE